MPELPTGTVTLVFTDIQGSSDLWEKHRAAFQPVLAEHNRLMRAAAARWNGYEVKTEGDAFFLSFARASDAVQFAVEAQRSLHGCEWGRFLPGLESVRVRIGMHAGEPLVDRHPDGTPDYFGPVVNRAARVGAAPHGGQVIISAAVHSLCRADLPAEVGFRDLGEHPLKGVGNERLWQVCHADLPAEFPPLRSQASLGVRLPVPSTPFVGRDRELRQARDLLAGTRLLTLTGPGGTGKTRLGLALATEVQEQFADGAAFVELAAIRDPSLVPSTVAQALGLREAEGGDVLHTLKHSLRERAFLLVLDNFEQVTAAASLVAELVGACPRLKVIVSSRVPLRVHGEQELPVPPLALPDRGRLPGLEALARCASVDFFVRRAAAVRPDFQLTRENAGTIVEVCTRLDGLPLALELAAARVKLLPPQALLARLDNRLKLLTSGSRDLPARQQTLRGAISWSHDLLSPEERALFRRLGVFAGGATLEAIEAVCDPDGSLGLDVFDGIAALVDNSLVRQLEGAGGEPRFTMLETIREFAVESLDASGEGAELRRQHAQFFRAVAEEGAPHLQSGAQMEWLDRLEADHDNLRAALEGSRASGDPETLLALAASLWYFWAIRGYFTEGRNWLEIALRESAGTDARTSPQRATALNAAAMLTYFLGAYDRMVALAEESRALCEGSGDDRNRAFALSVLGVALCQLGERERGAALNEEGRALAERAGEPWAMAFAWNVAAIIDCMEGRLNREPWERSRALFARVGDRYWGTYPLIGLGYVSQARGEYAESGPIFQESLTTCAALRNLRGIALSLAGLAGARRASGDAPGAARLLGASEALREAINAPIPAVYRPVYERSLAETQVALPKAAFEAARAEGRQMDLEVALAFALGRG